MPDAWSFQVMLVAHSASDVEAAAVETAARAAAHEALVSTAVLARDCSSEKPAASVSGDSGGDADGAESDSQSPDALADVEVTLTPCVLANAFQRLVRLDRDAHAAAGRQAVAHTDASDGGVESQATDAATSGHETEPDAPPIGPLADFAGVDHGESTVAPARIYLLSQYPASLAEMQALLRTGEAGGVLQGELPLLPLIDGVLLVVDPTRELREGRRKSLRLADGRRKSVSQRQILGAIASNATAITTSDEVIGSAAAVQSVFLTSNVLVRESYEASSVGGLEWSDFVFADVPCSTTAVKDPKGAADLTKELLTSAEKLAAHKYEFKRWVSTTKMIPIPVAQPLAHDDNASAMLKSYEQILRSVYEASVGVSVVLFAMKEAVVLTLVGTGESCTGDETLSNQAYIEEFITYGDTAALRLAVAYATFVKERAGGADFAPTDPCSVLGQWIDEVEKEMWASSDLAGVGNSGRKGMPVKALLSHTVRSVQDTEFRGFCAPFDVAQVHLTRQLQRFEDVLGESWKGKLQRTRCFVEELDRSVLPQRLAQILGNFPTMYSDYYAATDSLLVATLATTAPGRFRTTHWSAKDHVRHRPGFKDWRKERLLPDEYMTPRTLKAVDACVPLSSAELALVSEKTYALFPSDQSIIRVYQTPRGYSWLNVYQGGDVFGFRQIEASASTSSQHTGGDAAPAPQDARRHLLQFCASFEDSSQLHIHEGRSQKKKPDGFSTISATSTFPNGLTVTACSDGSIVQRYVSAAASASTSDRELYRLITGKGTVLCQFARDEQRVLLANGEVHTYTLGGSHEGEDLDRKSIRVVDPATNALVERRANGVVVVTHTDGSRATYHVDGTCMFTNGSGSHVLVKKAGFADVCTDIAVNLAAQRHARGERVAVTKGGLRTRSTVNTYDGTRIEVGYNTKVIAQVNGRVTIRKPSGVCVVAKDSGRIEYQPPADWAPPPRASAEDADLNVTSHRGVYYFDNALGRFELCDHEENRFAVDFGGKSPRVTVDLAGIVSDADAVKYEVERIPATAVVSDPIEPHLLVLNGDGTGCELLRPRDIEQFLLLATRGVDTNGVRKEVSADHHQQQQQQPRVFFEELQQHPRAPLSAVLLDDPKLHAEMQRLARPVNAAAKHLERFYSLEQPPQPQFTLVRKLRQIRPLSDPELEVMHAALHSWHAWQHARERNKDQYRVEDPRDADTIAQHAAAQKKVVAAYKAARSRKKLERMRARELKRQTAPGGGCAKMETVQEGDEPQADEHDDGDASSDSDGDAFDCSSSGGGSDADGDDVDDPAELLWTAFTDVDTGNTGRLSVAQTRQALVHVLGVGVSTPELLAALRCLRLQDDVDFDSFAELARVFRGDERSASSSASVPALEGFQSAMVWKPSSDGGGARPRTLAAAGSAADAVLKQKEARQQQREHHQQHEHELHKKECK